MDADQIPAHAVSLWFSGDSLVFTAPASPGESAIFLTIPIEKAGIVTTPQGSPLTNQLGWKALLDILKARYHTSHRTQRTIGMKSSPVEYDLEKMLKKITYSKKPLPPEITLEDLDI